MIGLRAPSHPRFRHEVLIHDDDASLVSATRHFVERGLEAGADVLVHSNRSQVAALRGELRPDPRLSYGYDEEMYTSPTQTLFKYQRQLAARKPGARELWVTGTVPRGATNVAQAAWARYESAVNEALGPFSFRALCTYDTRTASPSVIATARAAHPHLETGSDRVPCPDYLAPADFLADPLAMVPQSPRQAPILSCHVGGLDDVPSLRDVVRAAGRSASAIPFDAIEGLILAVHEVTANGILHGAPPVRVHVWAELDKMVVEVLDAGPGGLDPVAGYRFPDALGALGLWVARQEVDDLIIDTPLGGGCRVLLFKS
jgi:anti-sigma regulatory factor (Ser/Thr protein kinase)